MTSDMLQPQPPPIWYCTEFERLGYRQAWDLQGALVTARKQRRLETDILLLLEHPPVFTLGKRGGGENLNVSEAFLAQEKIDVVQVERGGNITYHGPGQLVVYPIFDLEAARLQVDRYVTQMEEVMLRTAEDFGVHAKRNPRNRGIWVGNNKMGSIGIALRRGISFHGFALNGTLALTPFSWINPCGLEGVGVTSVAQESSREVSMALIRAAVKQHWQDVFEVVLRATSPSELQALLTPSEAPQER